MNTKYAFLITVDKVFGDDPFYNRTGTIGPSATDATVDHIRRNGRAFRLLDDDLTVCYHGRTVGGEGTEPLDDFGLPYCGCTTIQYRVDGRWTTI